MSTHQLHVLLSSPGEVGREWQLAREGIDRIQSERAYRGRLKLDVVAWDKPGEGTVMPAQMEPQEAINRGRISAMDRLTWSSHESADSGDE